MTQHQKTGTLTSTDSIYIKAHDHKATTNDEEMQSSIDSDSMENYFDLSELTVPEIAYDKSPKCSPKQHIMTAKEPVKLLELHPIISNLVSNESHNSKSGEIDNKPELKSRKRFQCIFCGSKFTKATHLHRHLRIHTGAKPHFCPICRKPFSRRDYMLAHMHHHSSEKVHYCCVCGEAYFDFKKFANHSRSHHDCEYIRIAMSNAALLSKDRLEKSVQTVEDFNTGFTFPEQLESASFVTIDNNFTEEECIVYVENPINSSHHSEISVNSS